MLTPQELKKSPLFQDIGYENYQQMLDCFQAVQRSYRVDEVIYDFSGPAGNAVGVVERGEASMIRIDEEGVATVLEELGPGGVFGKSLAFSTSGRDSLQVICRTACEVVFIDYPRILKRCGRACTHHSLLVQNMLRLISDKAQALSERVDVLSRRSIREKLLCYFRIRAGEEKSLSFSLPFTLSALAEYLCVDRSAMMRELKKLREAGFLEVSGKQVRFLSDQPFGKADLCAASWK